MDHFEGKCAVITGGANGIGFATATELARRGARVVLADVDKPALEQAVARLAAEGFDAHAVMCDVGQLDEMVHLADESFRLLGQVDIVFSNAGIVVAGPIAQMMHTLPVGWVEPEDISNAVLFLASDESRYVTGVTLPIDAGSCLK